MADGTFRPDAARAGYFTKANSPVPAASITEGRDTTEAKVEFVEDSDEEARNTRQAARPQLRTPILPRAMSRFQRCPGSSSRRGIKKVAWPTQRRMLCIYLSMSPEGEL